MGFIVPDINIQFALSNVSFSNAYVAIAHYDVNFRNYSNPLPDAQIGTPSSDSNAPISVTAPYKGMSLLVNYGIWDSHQSRIECNMPLQIQTKQFTYTDDASLSNVYSYAYDMIKATFSNAQDV